MVKKHSQLVIILMGLMDLAVTAGVLLGCYYIRFYTGWVPNTPPPDEIPPSRIIQNLTLLTLVLSVLVFQRFGLYQPRRIQTFRREALDLIRACAIVWMLEVLLSHFLYKPRVSIILQAMFLVAWPSAMLLYRGTARGVLRWFRSRGRNMREAAIIGTGRAAQKLRHTLQKHSWTGYRVWFFIGPEKRDRELLGLPVHGPYDRIGEILDEEPVDTVFVALPRGDTHRLQMVLDHLSQDTVDIHVVPDLSSTHFLQTQPVQIGRLPVVNLTHCRQAGWSATAKRVMDVTVAGLALLVLSPLLLAIAIAVKRSSPGPVFYRQQRASFGGLQFDILKFRSMVENADQSATEWSTARDDPRVTGIGKFLRRFSLDELPQLLNVLKGDMSLVGPRPERPEFIQRFRRTVPRYMMRHHVKAGITGWGQVNGYRGRTSLRKRIQYDLDYINNWSIWFDVYILLLTCTRGFINREE